MSPVARLRKTWSKVNTDKFEILEVRPPPKEPLVQAGICLTDHHLSSRSTRWTPPATSATIALRSVAPPRGLRLHTAARRRWVRWGGFNQLNR